MSRTESSLKAHYPYRRFPALQISPGAYFRLLLTDRNVGRCILEHLRERVLDVNHVHCIPRCLGRTDATFNPPINRLEWFWNLPRYSLNLDSRYNIFFLGSNFHYGFLRGLWHLVPEMEFINAYYESITPGDPISTRENFPHVPDGPYNYRMIPLPNQMKLVPVIRREDATRGETGRFQIYVYPFENLQIPSHIHPRFVIYRMGRKLEHRLTPDELASLTEAHPSLVHKVRTVYAAWTQAIPPDAEDDPLFRPPTPEPANTEERERDSDKITAQRRIALYTLRTPKLTKLWDICPDRGLFLATESSCYRSTSEDSSKSDSMDNANWSDLTDSSCDVGPKNLSCAVDDIDVDIDVDLDVDGGMESMDNRQNTPPMRTEEVRRLRRRRMKMKEILERRKHGPTTDSAGQVQLTDEAMWEHDESQEDFNMWENSSIAEWCTSTREALSLESRCLL